MRLLIDIGNTSAKIAVAPASGEILHLERLVGTWDAALLRLTTDYSIDDCVVSCVGRLGDGLQAALDRLSVPNVWISTATPCAITGVPEGYGADRIAADIGAYDGQHALLVIDAGTCITYDLLLDGRIAGGVITPGAQLRLHAMHDHTKALPLIHLEEAGDGPVPLTAMTTTGCMLSAAINGTRFEIEGYIRTLRQTYPDLAVVLTGGNHFDINPDIPHTYDPQLVLKGLQKIAI